MSPAKRYDHGVGIIDVELSVLELGWLNLGVVWKRAQQGDPIARGLYLKLRAAAIECGVDWYYGDPFDVETELRMREAREAERLRRSSDPEAGR